MNTITIFNPERCWKCRAIREQRDERTDRCAACGAAWLIGLHIRKPEAFRFVLELLEDRNLVHHAERPQSIPTPFPVHSETWQTVGNIYIEAGTKLDEARAVLEARQYTIFEEAGPVVDRHDPICPACSMMMDPAQDEACPACAQPVRWIDVPDEDALPLDGVTCRRCGYDLSGQQARRCPECNLPAAVLDTPQISELAEKGTHDPAVSMKSSRPGDALLQIAAVAGIIAVIVLLVADMVLGVVAMAVFVICTLIVKYVRSQARELERDRAALRGDDLSSD